MNKLIISMVLLILSFSVAAQTGTIKGKVQDADTKESLVGTTILLKGTTIGTITDFDGNYIIPKVAPGKYSLIISFISYNPQEIEIEVKANVETVINAELQSATIEVGDVKVVAKANRETESMLLVEQKKSVIATQAIGAQEISRKGASDAEAAVTKLSGISKQEGVKNVFVRGLGDRFNSTSLNGFPVPSEDPEYKNISLDFFSSDIIKAVDVRKVFNSEMTGDVAGAEININSKELVGDKDLNVEISANTNSNTLNQKFLLTSGVNALGFAENAKSPEDNGTFGFKNLLDPSTQNFQMGKGFSFAGGKKLKVGTSENPLSFYLIGEFSNDFNYINGISRGNTTTGEIYQDQETNEFLKRSTHLMMGNLNYNFNKYQLSYNSMLIHTSKQKLLDKYGMDDSFQSSADYGYVGLIRRQQNNDNTLIVNQARLTRKINKRLDANIGASFNYINGKEPDRRINHLGYYGEDILKPLKGTGNQQRYFSVLKESDLNTQLEGGYKLDDEGSSAIKMGYKMRWVKDNFNANEWDNSRFEGSSNLPELNRYNFSLDSIFNTLEYEEGNFDNDLYTSNYSVDKMIHSVYADLIYQLTPKLTLNAGLQLALINIDVSYSVNKTTPGETSLNEKYLLPSFNLKQSLNDKNALRLGVSRTYTLPQSKEISPFRYTGEKWNSQGNTNLLPSTNYNIDLKWDYYISRDELLSAMIFGKIIKDPISRIEKASAGGFLTYENIADNATIGGVEIEIRKNIFANNNTDKDATTKLSSGVNFSYIKTDVTVDEGLNFTNSKTKLEGASPFLANADLSLQYKKTDFDMTASVIANYFSDRTFTIGAGGYQDINEDGLVTMDFISAIKFKERWGISLKARNLLDPEFRLTRKPNGEGEKPITLSSYKKGIDFSLGLTYQF